MEKLFLLLALLTLGACQSPESGGPRPQSATPGYLQGHVDIGPLTPVERVGVPTPTVSPQVYAARQIIVFKSDGKTEVARPKIDDQGNYRVELTPGSYVVAMARNGIDRANRLPASITVESGKTTVVDISIDTGIR